MRIQQASFTRPRMRATFPMFTKRWGLREYDNPDEPALFIGCYNRRELRRIQQHHSLAVVLWLGSDFNLNGAHTMFKNRCGSIKHVAIGKFLEDDLRKEGLPFHRHNVMGSPLIDDLRPAPLGDKIYYYYNDKANHSYEVFCEVIKRFGANRFIVHNGLTIPQKDMPLLYQACAIGLRLTQHDGGAEGVVEMGLMGRHCVYNGDVPNAIPWHDVESICLSIERRLMFHGEIWNDLAEAVHEYVQWDPDWLDVHHWQNCGSDVEMEAEDLAQCSIADGCGLPATIEANTEQAQEDLEHGV